ncbi:Methyltransferase type 12 [Jannaschia sp. CCS1]|nr:Methyltransferase type 12 [Jannaschia sp. CCS1]
MDTTIANPDHDLFAMNELPKMTSAKDMDLVTRFAEGLEPDAVIVEIGPWLGALSDILSPKGCLHVVDAFVWTDDHDKRVPGLLSPGESFRAVYQRLMQDRGRTVEVHETALEDFRWAGDGIDLCIIDAPKKPTLLRDTLLAVASGLHEGSRLLIKNANHANYFAMMAYLQAIVDQGVLSVLDADEEGSCNMIAFDVRVSGADLAEVLEQTPLDHSVRWRLVEGGLGGLGPFQLALICELIKLGQWAQAYEVVGRMQSSRRILREWDRREAQLANAGADPEQLGWFAEIMGLQHSKGGLPAPPKTFRTSAAMARRAYWINNSDKPWRARAFHPDVFERAHEFGYMKWTNSVQDHIKGQSVLDVGCGPGLHGFGCLVAGAKTYLGLDPIIKLERDRVKNLSANSAKMAFGWTPAALADMFEPWEVQAAAIETLPEDRVFDIAVMHNVTEHLQNIESVFESIALRLKPGGKVLYNHHNFFCWNGHHQPPKRVSKIDLTDAAQQEMVDWGHVEYEPTPDHYIARGLNRIRLDDLIALTERFFDIEVCEERPSRPETGLGRLTDEIRQKYPYLKDRDFETQNLFCIATVKI